jgi:hypothetical protein
MAMTDVDQLQKTPLTATPPPAAAPVATISAPQPKIMKSNSPVLTILLTLVVILAGIGSGYAIFQIHGKSSATSGTGTNNAPASANAVKVNQTYGHTNPTDDKAQPEGVLLKGGISGEGSHHLIRPGGADQNVYLTSSELDLDLFAGDKVQVWGQTFQAQKAGWLMDVSQVKVLQLNVATPDATSAAVPAE